MDNRVMFFVLTFMIIVIVVMSSTDMLHAMIMVSLLANFLVISGQFSKISRGKLDVSAQEWPAAARPANAMNSAAAGGLSAAAIGTAEDRQFTDLYGPYYEMWHAYQDGYTSVYDPPHAVTALSCAEKDAGFDTSNAYMAQRRARDRKCTDGWLSRDSSYFKYHYGSELDDAEKRVWWGNFDH